MKTKVLIFSFVSLLFNLGCTATNTTDVQKSKSIKESKEKRVYIKEYTVTQYLDSQIIIEEAWLEKGWFNEIHNGKIIAVPSTFCQLCFKIKQTPLLLFKLNDFSKWLMQDQKTHRFVGIKSELSHGMCTGVYSLTMDNCALYDSIVLNLMTKSGVQRKQVGKLVFK